MIGGGWAARFLLNGWDVSVFDPDPEAERKISEVLDNARQSLPMLYERSLPTEGTLNFVATVADAVADADYVQESVPERLGVETPRLCRDRGDDWCADWVVYVGLQTLRVAPRHEKWRSTVRRTSV